MSTEERDLTSKLLDQPVLQYDTVILSAKDICEKDKATVRFKPKIKLSYYRKIPFVLLLCILLPFFSWQTISHFHQDKAEFTVVRDPYLKPFFFTDNSIELVAAVSKTPSGQTTLHYESTLFKYTLNPTYYHYQKIDYFGLQSYLKNEKDSLLSNRVYYNTILNYAAITDIDPLLLFAIIGQEQGFVPSSSPYSNQIINNPFNVYHSWVTYNTTIGDSTLIAIATIKNRLNTLPPNENPIKWVNLTYAEDQAWHIGVNTIYGHLANISRVD